ncbi:MAG: DUF3048 domain-containing protein, partial [Chloroflexi bacterium]|nr:DUF3048 domain-containing protein [Chloroflexota bacterium]
SPAAQVASSQNELASAQSTAVAEPTGQAQTIADQIDSDPDADTGLVGFSLTSISGDLDFDPGMFSQQVTFSIEEQTSSYSIGDFVWLDANGDGIQDADEPGVEGVTVTLHDDTDAQLDVTQTDANGLFAFTDVPPGDAYYLAFTLPEGYAFTLMNEGSDDAADSDADPASGETAPFSTSADTFDWDAGVVQQVGGGAPLSYCVGPDPEDFPNGYSPLTGQPVEDPSLLSLRPVFLSVSLFPPSVRPPTGASVSPIIYQFYIGDGDTRTLMAVHGELPEIVFDPETTGASNATPDEAHVVGNWVWFDLNGNSVQDEGEPGVPRIPVKLWVNGSLFAQTETDDGGFYFFGYDDAESLGNIQLEFDLPEEYADYYFVNKGAGSARSLDSDVFVEGFTDVLDVPGEIDAQSLDIDVGLRRSTDRIEGVRSGRVFYEDIRQQYCGCVITAGADPLVAAQIQTCANAVSNNAGDIGAAGVDITQLGNIAQQSTEGSSCSEPNLTGNLFCTETTLEGAAGIELFTFWNINNQDHFVYDPEAGAYNWYKNLPSANESFDLMTDGLNGETLTYENVIVMLTEHTQVNADGTIFEMNLGFTTGTAYIFRNGQMYEAMWSTIGGEYEQGTGLQRPFRFTDMDGNPFPLAPGQTFVQLLHTFHVFEEVESGVWRARWYAPVYTP